MPAAPAVRAAARVGSTVTACAPSSTADVGAATAVRTATMRATAGNMSAATRVEMAATMRAAAVRAAAMRAFMLSERGVWDAGQREGYS